MVFYVYNRKNNKIIWRKDIYIMIGKNNYKLHLEKDGERVTRYSIKKFTVGTASVAVAASIFFGMGSVAHAAEVNEETTTNKVEVKQEKNISVNSNQNIQQNNSKPVVTEQPTSNGAAEKEVTSKETAEKEVISKEAVNKATTEKETTSKEAINKETTEKEATSEETVNEEIINKKRGRKSLVTEESSNKESVNTAEVDKKEETNKNVESNQEATEEVDKVMLEVAIKEATELQSAENVDE